MEAKGPVGHIEYNGRGNFKIGKVRVRTTVSGDSYLRIYLIANVYYYLVRVVPDAWL
jgi:hypothetical protein